MTKRHKVKVSVTRPIEYRIVDIGPGRSEHNVQTGVSNLQGGKITLAKVADAVENLTTRFDSMIKRANGCH